MTATTTLQVATTGQMVLARDLPGLVFTPQAQPQPMVDPYSANPYSHDPYQGQQYGGFNQGQPGLYNSGPGQFPFPTVDPSADRTATTSFLLSASSLFCCPVLAPFAMYYALMARSKGARSATAALIVAGIANLIVLIGVFLVFVGVSH